MKALVVVGLFLFSAHSAWAGSIIPLGCPDAECAETPPPNSGFVGVATGNYHSMGLRAFDGSIATWGMCDVGQCGVPLPNSGYSAIAAGDSHSLALRGGTIVAWGSNESGQLDVPEPNAGYVAMAAGGLHNVALRSNGTIVGWGYTPWGDVLPQVPNSNWAAIAAGGYFSIGLKIDGTIHRWGCNGPCPVPAPNTGFAAVSTHFHHSLAVRAADGSIVAWGDDTHGQLDVPVHNSGFISVAAGDHFSLGLRSDGTVAAWGSFDRDDVALPNRGYLAISANRGLSDLLKSDASDPVFSEAPPLTTRGQTAFALAADIDADGDQDIVSADYGADTVSWYENDGGSPPRWTKRVVDGGALGPQQVAAGDLDGDGDLDVLSSNFNEDGVFWYQNSGADPPVWTKRFVSSVAAWGVHVADLDGDGDVDGIAGNRWDNTPEHKGVEWYENDGAAIPAFTVRRISAGFVDASSVHAADVDDDGDTDVLSVDVFRNSVYWFENDGAHPPAWTQRTVTSAADDPFSVFPADVDDDGDVDVLSASTEDDTVAWYENDGAPTPAWTRRVITSQAPQAIAVFAGDLDGDGDVDVTSGSWGNEIAWYESDGASPPSFTRRVVSHLCRGPQSVFAARLDPDADVDLVASCGFFPGEIQWYPSWAAQAESDQDGVPDAADCAPTDSTAYAIPGTVRDVRFEFEAGIAWTPPAPTAGSSTVYDVVRGSLSSLSSGGAGAVCFEQGTTMTFISEGTVPAPGTGFYYLVRAVNACGNGSYGTRSSGVERTSAACP